MTHNPIYPGYIWRQAFDFPEGFFEAGDVVRAEFRRFANDAAPLASIEGGTGAVIEDNRLFVELDAEQTEAIARGGARTVTNFVVVRRQEEIPIGQIVSIPVVTLPTRPE